jgi:hypothetical protein
MPAVEQAETLATEGDSAQSGPGNFGFELDRHRGCAGEESGEEKVGQA